MLTCYPQCMGGDRVIDLQEAVQMVLEANRELAQRGLEGKEFEKEPFELSAA